MSEVAAAKLGQRRFAGRRRSVRHPIIQQHVGRLPVVPIGSQAEDALQGGEPDQVNWCLRLCVEDQMLTAQSIDQLVSG